MAGLLTPNPNFSWGQFGGNALAGIGQGLLAYGAGGQLRQQAPLIAIQGMQQAQQAQAEQAQRALQTQSLTQQLAMQQMQMQRAQQADQQAAQQKQQYLGLLGGQAVQGPTQSGAPLDIKSPVNPALSNLSPAMQQMLPLMDPSQGMGMIAQSVNKKPDVPNLETWRDGDQVVSGYLDANGTKHEVSRGSAFAPQQAPQAPAGIQEYSLAKSQGFKGSLLDYQMAQKGQGVSMTMPDGTVVQVGGNPKITNDQAQAGSRATMIQGGVSQLEKLYNSPNISVVRSTAADISDTLGPVGKVIGQKLRSDDEQQWQSAQAAALEGMAAAVTGAGVTQGQFERYQSLLPQITDKPENRKSKLKFANDFLKSQLRAAGPAGADLAKQIDAAPKSDQSSAPTKVYNYNPTTGQVE